MAAPAHENKVTDQKKYQEFLEEGIKAWEDYKATGLHLTGEEMDQWIHQVAQGKDVELPECHK
ncbi:hypothetical protein [Marinospirillum sp.]|uniref:hypothetical protein n=1 Tax=Marinospirillum sp. TaxID=2183934 RepID=UPI0028703766|nr:hypothetical protein [Marinospirillum sp.]MDR9467824.1 hypothetical protein [Marinospirillum sp.]